MSKTFGVACLMTTAAYYLNLYDAESIALIYGLVFKRLQVCNPNTFLILKIHFLIHSPFNFLDHVTFLFKSIAGLEAYHKFLLSWTIFISICISSYNDVNSFCDLLIHLILQYFCEIMIIILNHVTLCDHNFRD